MSDRWLDSLPTETHWNDPVIMMAEALTRLSWALVFEGDKDVALLHEIRLAAADIRAWRKSLPVQGEQMPAAFIGHPDRGLIHAAIRSLLNADEHSAGPELDLRWAEACLRALGLRIMDRMENTPK